MSDDVSSLTPEAAGAKLAEMTEAYRATQPQASALDQKYSDAEWRGRLEAGHPEARREFDELVIAQAAADPVKAAMTGNLPTVPSSDLRQMEAGANWLRADGFSDAEIAEFLSGKPQPQAFKDQIAAGKQRFLNDPAWVQKWQAGDPLCKKQMAYADMIAVLPTQEGTA